MAVDLRKLELGGFQATFVSRLAVPRGILLRQVLPRDI